MLYYSYTLMFSLFTALLLCCFVSFCSLLDGVCLSGNKNSSSREWPRLSSAFHGLDPAITLSVMNGTPHLSHNLQSPSQFFYSGKLY